MTVTNPTADCGPLPLPISGSLLQPHTNTTEGSMVVFQCDPGFVPEGEMTAVCGRDGQWNPNPRGVSCSQRPTPTSTPTFTEASILTPSSTPDFSGPGEAQLLLLCSSLYKIQCKHIRTLITLPILLVQHGITFLQDPVMKEATSLPCVPPVLPSQQLSPVLCHSSLEHWLVLWYTTIL